MSGFDHEPYEVTAGFSRDPAAHSLLTRTVGALSWFGALGHQDGGFIAARQLALGSPQTQNGRDSTQA